MSKKTKFGKWWYWNGGITTFLTSIALAALIPVYMYLIPTYYRSEIQESTIRWEKPEKGKGFWVLGIDGDQWYTYNKFDYYDVKDGSEASENTEDCLDKVFEMQNTKGVQNFLESKKEKEKEEKQKQENLVKENKKLKEENKNLKKNQTEL